MRKFSLIALLALIACAPSNDHSVTANGITIEASNFHLDGNQAKVDICHEFPDARDWTIWKAKVVAGQIEIDGFEMSLIELRQPAINGKQEVITLYDNVMQPDQNSGWGCVAIPSSLAGSLTKHLLSH